MNISAERLLAIAQSYWPVTKDNDSDLKYKLLTDLWEQELKRNEQWHAFRRDLKKAFPGFTIGDATATPDACFRCPVYPPDTHAPAGDNFIVVGCKSILAPVYTVYGVEYELVNDKRRNIRVIRGPFPDGMQRIVDVMSRTLEVHFGVSLLPREVSDTPVPLYVEPMEPPHTTLFHALFTSQPESLP